MVDNRKRRYNGDEYIGNYRDSGRYESESRNPDMWIRRPGNYPRRSDYGTRRPNIQRFFDRQPIIKTKIDRSKTCPMLIRVFCNIGRHNKPSDFNDKKFPENELRIYTWRDASLKELMGLVTEAFPESRTVGTCFDFSIVYPNFKQRSFEIKDLGSTCSGQDRVDENITLDSTKFQVGDCLDVAIFPPRSRIPKL